MTPTSPAPAPAWRLPFLGLLLLVSGACGLIYQTAWLREFRLIFGGATPATAAVLAVFMGGLGVGGWWFGRRAERSPNLLRLYAALELGIAATVAVSPFLLDLVRALYLKTGGVLTLGPTGASLAHLLLTMVVIGLPCVLLGGNLPPAVKWVETDADAQRGALGVVYGCNAMGAVFGVLLATFWALEHLGTRSTLWLAAALNAVIGLVALAVARRDPGESQTASVPVVEWQPRIVPPKAPPRFVYAAAALTGFIFFLTELVWFRMLTPLLGGTVYCFGLILATVLFGIALGGWLYRARIASVPGRVNLGTLAVLATLQAAVIALPWALGDRWAITSFHLLQLRSLGFGGLTLGWAITVAGVVLAPAILAGMQFPLLVGLLGEGRRDAARQVGSAYAANTAGAIAGSLLGGFLLLPWLSAPGCWKLAVALTLGLGFVALLIWERPWATAPLAATLASGMAAVALGFHAMGPTAVWRHTALGYGVVPTLPPAQAELEDQMRAHRRHLAIEFEGRESSIAIARGDEGWVLFSNGKPDGSALSDVGTQVMLGLIGAVQHPDPRTAFVIGLGTGTSAGWIGDIAGMERVDVVELEPAVVRAAATFFGPVNRDALLQTNLHVTIGDAREVLLATRRSYDLIVSEPPNPYRAGVASLFTREYYQAVRQRLNPGGIFSQWLQGYQLSNESVQIVYATLLSVFPYVETWVTQANDLAFVCHLELPAYPLSRIADRLRQPLFAEATGRAWLSGTLEGFFSHYLAGPETARRMAAGAVTLNTDDRNVLEYGLARNQLGEAGFRYQELLAEAIAAIDDLPPHLRTALHPDRVLESRFMLLTQDGTVSDLPPGAEGTVLQRSRAILAWARHRHDEVLTHWTGPITSPAEQIMLAVSAARAGTPEHAQPLLDDLALNWPAEAQIATAWLAFRHGDGSEAVDHLIHAFTLMRNHPWVTGNSLTSVVDLTAQLAPNRPQDAERLLQAWSTPLAVGLLARSAPTIWYRLSTVLPPVRQLEVLDAIGPDFPWTRDFLHHRRSVLESLNHPFAPLARRDHERYLRQEGRLLADILPPLPSGP